MFKGITIKNRIVFLAIFLVFIFLLLGGWALVDFQQKRALLQNWRQGELLSQEKMTELLAYSTSFLNLCYFLLIMGGVCSFLAILKLYRSIFRPLDQLNKALQARAKDKVDLDLDFHLESSGEFSALSQELSELMKHLRNVLETVEESNRAGQVTSRKGEQALIQLAEKLKKIEVNLFNFTKKLQTIPQFSKPILEGLKEMKDNLAKIGVMLSEGDSNVKQAIEALRILEAERQVVADKQRGVSKSLKEFIPDVDLMDKLALRTKILALNAGIEAEQAGSYGMGFAVIAQEIKNIADQIKKISEQQQKDLSLLTSEFAAATQEASKQLLSLKEEIKITNLSQEEIWQKQNYIKKTETKLTAMLQQIDPKEESQELAFALIQDLETDVKQSQVTCQFCKQEIDKVKEREINLEKKLQLLVSSYAKK